MQVENEEVPITLGKVEVEMARAMIISSQGGGDVGEGVEWPSP